MESPFDTPTVRPSDPINETLNAERTSHLRVNAHPSSPPPPSRPSLSPTMRSYDKSTSSPSSRMSQSRATSFVSPSKKSTSIYEAPSSSSFLAKNPRTQSKRFVNDNNSRRGSKAETQSIMSMQRGPQAQDFQDPTPEELVRFAALCRRQYYDNDTEAGEYSH